MIEAPPDRAALLALLDFHVAAGVDCALDETPHDRFAEDATAASARSTAQPVAAPPALPAPDTASASPSLSPSVRRLPAPPQEAAAAARSRAAEARTLDELRDLMASFEGCALRFSAKNLAFADGVPGSRVMLVGEAPGAEEDRTGKPFVGRAGQLLDRMLAAIGLDRTSVYIANIVPWRPPGNRTPTPQEIVIMKPFIERQIELAAPEFLVCLGGPSTQTLLGARDGILRTRGRWFSYALPGRTIRALASLHPAYLLRQPLQKRLAWRDLRSLEAALAETAAREPGRGGPV
jgi:uracil-DNA glycosylase family 4